MDTKTIYLQRKFFEAAFVFRMYVQAHVARGVHESGRMKVAVTKRARASLQTKSPFRQKSSHRQEKRKGAREHKLALRAGTATCRGRESAPAVL